MLRTSLIALAVLAAPVPSEAQDPSAVIACDTLIAARRLDAAAGARTEVPTESGCRRIPRDSVGTVEQRALIGGAPYECLTIVGGPCLWIVP